MLDEKYSDLLIEENKRMEEKRQILKENVAISVESNKRKIKLYSVLSVVALTSIILCIVMGNIRLYNVLGLILFILLSALCFLLIGIFKSFKKIKVLYRELDWYLDYSDKAIKLNLKKINN